jgi:hypothetical protein
MDDFTKRMLSSGKPPEATTAKDTKPKNSGKALRRFFGILAALYFFVFAGHVATAILLFRGRPDAHLSPLFLASAIFFFAISLTFAFTVAKFNSLITKHQKLIRFFINAYFWGSIALGLAAWYDGLTPNFLGGIVQVIIYIYLLKLIDRISNEAPEVQFYTEKTSRI